MTRRFPLLFFALAILTSLCGAARCVSAEPELKKFDPLTTWEQALHGFEAACQLLVDGKLTEATKRLDRLAAELPRPYSNLAGNAAERIANLSAAKAKVEPKHDLDAAKRLAALSWICESLGCDKQADWFADAARAATDAPYLLSLPRANGLSGARTLSRLRAEKAAAKTSAKRLRFGKHAIAFFEAIKDEKGRRAWEDKLAIDFPEDEEIQFLATFRQVESAQKEHDTDAAIALWQRLMDRFPVSYAGLCAESRRNELLEKSGRLGDKIGVAKELLEHAQQFVERKRQSPDRRFLVPGVRGAAALLWEHYESAGQVEDAIKYARLTIQWDAPFPRCGNDECQQLMQLQLAELLLKVGQCDEALAIAMPLEKPTWVVQRDNRYVARAQTLVKKIRAEFPHVKEPAPEKRQPIDE